jgi:hypothetical protein
MEEIPVAAPLRYTTHSAATADEPSKTHKRKSNDRKLIGDSSDFKKYKSAPIITPAETSAAKTLGAFALDRRD